MMGWAGHVGHMAGREMHSGFCWGSQRKTDQLKDIDVDGNAIKGS